MTPTLELHAVQAYPPSLLNRDDTGAPKDAYLGGVRRVRVSSQAQKLAMRRHLRDAELIAPEYLAVRTRHLADRLADALATLGHGDQDARALAVNTVWGMGLLGPGPDNAVAQRSNVLLFLSESEITAMAEKIHASAQDLLPAALQPAQIWPTEEAKAGKKEHKASCPKPFQAFGKPLLRGLDGSRGCDLALFGRMLAEEPRANIDGALSVAHAIGVDEYQLDLDYFTAVDDDDQQHGAAHLDTGYLTTPLLYRYAAIDMGLLTRNLAGDDKLVESALIGAVTAFTDTQLTAKHTSTGPYTRPAAVIAVVREDQPLSLADAFVRPVRATRETDLLTGAVKALAAQWRRIGESYGHDGVAGVWHLSTLEDSALRAEPLPGDRVTLTRLRERATGIALGRAEAS